jgi:hypothetical protein
MSMPIVCPYSHASPSAATRTLNIVRELLCQEPKYAKTLSILPRRTPSNASGIAGNQVVASGSKTPGKMFEA